MCIWLLIAWSKQWIIIIWRWSFTGGDGCEKLKRTLREALVQQWTAIAADDDHVFWILLLSFYLIMIPIPNRHRSSMQIIVVISKLKKKTINLFTNNSFPSCIASATGVTQHIKYEHMFIWFLFRNLSEVVFTCYLLIKVLLMYHLLHYVK